VRSSCPANKFAIHITPSFLLGSFGVTIKTSFMPSSSASVRHRSFSEDEIIFSPGIRISTIVLAAISRGNGV